MLSWHHDDDEDARSYDRYPLRERQGAPFFLERVMEDHWNRGSMTIVRRNTSTWSMIDFYLVP